MAPSELQFPSDAASISPNNQLSSWRHQPDEVDHSPQHDAATSVTQTASLRDVMEVGSGLVFIKVQIFDKFL